MKTIRDNRTIYDYSNLYVDRNYNVSGIEYIDSTIYSYFMQPEYNCETCKRQFSFVIPPCLSKCRFKPHSVKKRNPKNGKYRGRACFETYRGDDLSNIFFSKTHFALNNKLHEQYGYNQLVRPGKDAGFEANHINGDPFDDRPENIGLLYTHGSEWNHRTYHSSLNALRAKAVLVDFEIQKYIENNQPISMIKKWKNKNITLESAGNMLDDIHMQMNRIISVDIPPPIIKYLDEAQECINRGELFEPDWIKEKLERYKKKYILVRKEEKKN